MLGSFGERWSRERRCEHLERISASAAQLKELLVIGRADVGQLVAAPSPLDLRGFCEHLIETLTRGVGPAGEPLSAPPGVVPRVRFTFRGERKVCLDQCLLTHVLGNLLENALAYSSSGLRDEPVNLQPDEPAAADVRAARPVAGA